MTIPLRAAWNVPRTRRANRAITEIKNHVARHMKKREDEDIWIDEAVNHYIWSRGMQKPPRKIKTSAPEKRIPRGQITGGIKWEISGLLSSK